MSRMIIALVFASLINHALAATRAWWHFDESAAGTKTTTEAGIFINAVDPTTFAGDACEQDSGSFTSGGAQMPVYAESFPDGYYVYDPVTDSVRANAIGIRGDSSTGGPTGRAGGVKIPDAGLYGDTFTVEFMVKCSNNPGNTWETLLTRKNSEGKSSLVLRQQGGNLVGSYAYLEAGERKTASLAKFNCWQYGSLLNEKWHHVAFTVDQTVPELKVYADYQLTQTIALAGRLDFDDDGTLYLGVGDDAWGGCMTGITDEARVSDVVLEPSQFLRVQRMDRADVIRYYSFTALDAAFVGGTMMRGEISPTVKSGGASTSASVSTYAENITLHADAAPIENTDAGNLQQAYFAIPCDDAAMQTGDFTVEGMIRLPDGATSSGTQHYVFRHTKGIIADVEGRTLKFKDPSWTGVKDVSFKDANWHHVACVVDRTNGKIKYYYDYAIVATITAAVGEMAADSKFYFLSYDNGGLVFNTIDVDELRVSRGALGPEDFIRPAGSTDNSSCRLSFDATDFASFGYGFDGKAVTRETWGSFTIDGSDLPGPRIYDGRDDTTGVENAVAAGFAHSSGTGDFGGFYRIPDRSSAPLAESSFTAELFVKVDAKKFGGTNDATPSFLGQLNRFGIEYAYWNDTVVAVDATWKTFASAPFELGKWYHLAYVRDVANDELRFYVNRKLIGTKKGIPDNPVETKGNVYLMGSPKIDYHGTFTAAYADEIRLTTRVLNPNEFLSNRCRMGMVLIYR